MLKCGVLLKWSFCDPTQCKRHNFSYPYFLVMEMVCFNKPVACQDNMGINSFTGGGLAGITK